MSAWAYDGLRILGLSLGQIALLAAPLEAVWAIVAYKLGVRHDNIANREVEDRLLPIARDKGIAVIVNRPYQRGDLFRKVKGRPLPDWASKIDVSSWGQCFLKFVVSHPAVTCAIPATSKIKHMIDNMGAQFGRLPDASMRQEMVRYLFS